MAKFKIGQKVRIIADTFTNDPHELPIGTEGTIQHIHEATPASDMGHLEVAYLKEVVGMEPFDVPERYVVSTGDSFFDLFGNVVAEDITALEGEGMKVRMLETDIGYEKGDVFVVFEDEDGEFVFHDRDGDERTLEYHEYEIV